MRDHPDLNSDCTLGLMPNLSCFQLPVSVSVLPLLVEHEHVFSLLLFCIVDMLIEF